MDIEGRRQSSNVEDRRGMGPVRTGVGLSLGGILFLVVLSLLGINPLPFLGMATKEQPKCRCNSPTSPTRSRRRKRRIEQPCDRDARVDRGHLEQVSSTASIRRRPW